MAQSSPTVTSRSDGTAGQPSYQLEVLARPIPKDAPLAAVGDVPAALRTTVNRMTHTSSVVLPTSHNPQHSVEYVACLNPGSLTVIKKDLLTAPSSLD